MARKTSKAEVPTRLPISLKELSASIERRREPTGIIDTDIPRNAGNCRTESKKALLAALAARGAQW